MRALLINLKWEGERLAFQQAQAKNYGLKLEVLSAVTVAELDPKVDDVFWERWQRPLRDVEKATLQSHQAAWKRVVELGSPTLVLEDDAWLMPDAVSFIAEAARLESVEHLTLETRGRRKLIGHAHHHSRLVRRLWLDRTGAAAYLLWPAGALKLLARSQAVPALADAVIVETPRLLRWQAAPAQAIQLDMATRYSLVAPIMVASAISTVQRPSGNHFRYRMRRIYMQVRFGLSMLRPRTELVELVPDCVKLLASDGELTHD